jgi:RHS repeat-associated protein
MFAKQNYCLVPTIKYRTHPSIPLKIRHFRSSVCSVWDKGYRYGFNSMEKDNEIKVNGGSYDFGARIYDSRLGRWLSLDPLMAEYTSLSPYTGLGNNPVIIVDPDGRKIIPTNNFVKSRMFNTVQNIVNYIDVMPTLSKYIKVYLGDNLDLKLSTFKLGPLNGSLRLAEYVGRGKDKKTNKPGDAIRYNVYSSNQTAQTDGDEYEVKVLTPIGLASTFIHEVVYHASRTNLDHSISSPLLFDAIESLKEFSKNILKEELSNENAIALSLGGFETLSNFDQLLNDANTKYNTTLSKEDIINRQSNLTFKIEKMTAQEMGEERLDDESKTSSKDDTSGDSKSIVKQ